MPGAVGVPAARLLARPRPRSLGGRRGLGTLVTMASSGLIVTDRDEALKAGGAWPPPPPPAARGRRSPAKRWRAGVAAPRLASAPCLDRCHSLALLPTASRRRRFPPQIAIGAKTVAVLGIKTENHAGQPAYFVPEYMQSVGCKIIPVPGAHSAACVAWGVAGDCCGAAHGLTCTLGAGCLRCASSHRSAGFQAALCHLVSWLPCPPLPPVLAVYYPDVQQILGEPVVRDLKQASGNRLLLGMIDGREPGDGLWAVLVQLPCKHLVRDLKQARGRLLLGSLTVEREMGDGSWPVLVRLPCRPLVRLELEQARGRLLLMMMMLGSCRGHALCWRCLRNPCCRPHVSIRLSQHCAPRLGQHRPSMPSRSSLRTPAADQTACGHFGCVPPAPGPGSALGRHSGHGPPPRLRVAAERHQVGCNGNLCPYFGRGVSAPALAPRLRVAAERHQVRRKGAILFAVWLST